ncbi:hypothetical protein NDU88_003365 [Pleurodeles waltl]|uniref:Uncharacterized protein n=1 Tax=Pleurodeles waltl TaxID=8319 RepID=A0AAV7T5Z3_PLEWA|nr:hypothetical protein NDU88_003365 [Pleurodeles waltl]
MGVFPYARRCRLTQRASAGGGYSVVPDGKSTVVTLRPSDVRGAAAQILSLRGEHLRSMGWRIGTRPQSTTHGEVKSTSTRLLKTTLGRGSAREKLLAAFPSCTEVRPTPRMEGDRSSDSARVHLHQRATRMRYSSLPHEL